MKQHPIFRKTTPSGLTPAQKNLYESISIHKYELFCNEGANYKCWLEKNGLFYKNVDRRTANALSNKGLIKLDESFNSKYKFKMKLT